MNALTEKIRGNYNQVKGKLKEKYAMLTDDDLLYEEGKEDQWLGRLQEKTGEAKSKLKEMIDKV